MLPIAFEPAFSGTILKKLDKELKMMGMKKLKYFLADIGENAVEIGDNTDKIVSDGYRLLDLETMVRKDMVEERQNDKYFDCDPDDPNCDLYI